MSIITPPKVTIKVLEEAKKLGVQGVWLQPGTFDDAVLAYALKEFKAAVGGDGGTFTVATLLRHGFQTNSTTSV